MQPPDGGVPPQPPSAQPTLQPLSAADMVARAVQLWWRNLLVFAEIVAVVAVPVALLSFAVAAAFPIRLWEIPLG